MNNPFIKYLIKEEKKDVVHSSAYGKVQSGEAIGAASTQSFDERMKIEKNRQVIRGYNDSRVAEQRFNSGVRAKQYVPPEKKESLGVKPLEGGLGAQRIQTNTNTGKKSFTPPPYRSNFGK